LCVKLDDHVGLVHGSSSAAVEEVFVSELTGVVIGNKRVGFFARSFLTRKLRVFFDFVPEKGTSSRVEIKLLKLGVDNAKVLLREPLESQPSRLSTLATTDLKDIALTLLDVCILYLCSGQSFWDSCAESNSLLDGPPAFLLLNNQAAFCRGALDKASATLKLQRRWLGWALVAFVLASALGGAPD
jgi:hypothetical protein